jgi:signal transduction histidine kinase
VQSLIEMHGGSLTVTSELGRGSKFMFNLPVVVEDGDPTAVTI